MTATWLARHRAALVSPYEELTDGTRFTDQTLRQVIHLHRGGTSFRVHISNHYGMAAVDIGELRLGTPGGPSVRMTVGGSDSVVIDPGERVVTDPAGLTALDTLVVAMYVRSGPPATFHSLALQDCQVTRGNTTAGDTVPASVTGSLFFVEGVDAFDEPDGPLVVAFGDSLTDGHGTSHGANQRYPDHLAKRLGAPVINVGISGNRLLTDGYGESGLARFQHDVLEVPGATHVITALGVNDIGLATMFGEPQPTATDIVEGLTTLAERAREAGLVPIGGTLPPNAGTSYAGFHTPRGEKTRQTVNAWVRATTEYAAVIDFDEALRDPGHPARYRPALNSGDGLHPNDSGAAAMAEAIDLKVFQGS